MSNRRAVRGNAPVQHAPQQPSNTPKKLTASEIAALKANSRVSSAKPTSNLHTITRAEINQQRIPVVSQSTPRQITQRPPKRGEKITPQVEIDEPVVTQRTVQPRPVRKAEGFEPPKFVSNQKTANQIKMERLAASSSIDPAEYEKIKQARIRDMQKTKSIVKAKIVSKNVEKEQGDDEDKHYKYEYAEEEMDSWEEIKPTKTKKTKNKKSNQRDDAEVVRKSIAMLGRKNVSERIKVKDTDKEKYDIEDLDNISVPRNSKDKMPIVQLDNLNKLINRNVTGNKRDILLVGLSESTKDAVMDLLMETELGTSGHIFDTLLEENQTKEIPQTSFAVFSEKVPILPLDERDEESSEEEGVRARTRAKKKIVAKKPPSKKTTIAVGETYEETPFNIKEDYPSVRFIVLVKVSAHDRVDIKKLHENVAPFTPIEKFKQKFTELIRAECLIIDVENKKQIYHVDL